jgi:hypothetical protein
MTRQTRSIVGSARYRNRMTTPLEELKSDVDTLRVRMDVADSRAMETKQLLKGLRADVIVVKSDTAGLRSEVKSDLGKLGTQVGDLYSLMAAVPVALARIDRNVAGIKRDVAGLKRNVVASGRRRPSSGRTSSA